MDEYICSDCKREWIITKHKIFMRDKDNLVCSCGKEIISWNGAVMYSVRLKKEV